MTETEDMEFARRFEALKASLREAALSRAVQDCQDFIESFPDKGEGYFCLGILSYLSQREGDARKMLERAHELDPEVREYALMLSGLYATVGQLHDALYYSKLGVSYEERDDLAYLAPPELLNFVEATENSLLHVNYVNALFAYDQHDYARVIEQCELDLARHDNYEPAQILLGKGYIGLQSYGAAAELFQNIIDQNPNCDLKVLLLQAEVLFNLGMFDNAKQYIDLALSRDEADIDVACRCVSLLAKHPDSSAALAKLTNQMNEDHFSGGEPYYEPSPMPEGKIFIGFLSDKFYDCFEGRALHEVIKRLDPEKFVPFGYMLNFKRDALTSSFENIMTDCREATDINDKTLSLILRNDEIDVLVDMCGYGENHRLPLLARTPVNVQVNWLSPPYGLRTPGCVGSFCCAPYSGRDTGNADDFVLPSVLFSMPLRKSLQSKNQLTLKQVGNLVFGAKLDLAALAMGDGALFAQMLAKVPNATLKFAAENISDLELSLLNQYFGHDDISERVSLYTAEDEQTIDRFYSSVDVMLASANSQPEDISTPLQMSVPVIMRDRQNVMSSYAGLVLLAAEREGWQVTSDEAFIELASTFSDFDHLGKARLALKDNLLSTKLFDANTNALEFMYAVLNACDRVQSLKHDKEVGADDAK
ncbi:hypothetical protein V5T82_07625 [Magnetovibrio sp. PR-2]|uniref:hypothetical protein n=1 Tax=Magnetovibrio sp. PR-2 TaxID=3120356 RepID=UPI002FCDE2B1